MDYKELFSQFNALSEKDKAAFLNCVTQQSAQKMDVTPDSVRRPCPFCGRKARSNGKTQSGRQRYFCPKCRKSFSNTTGTIFEHTLKERSVWEKFIDCMLDRRTVRDCAKVCGISVSTAFKWRHKVLDSMQTIMEDVHMSGIIECDETFFRLSFKGDHKKSSSFSMPRKPHHRGNDNHVRGISNEQVCVVTAVTKGGLSIGKVSNLGAFRSEAIPLIYGGKFRKGATVCTDSNKVYNHMAEKLKVKHVKIEPQKHMNGRYGIQCINSYHSRLKNMIARCHGVATKYLNNYIVWNNFVNHTKLPVSEKKRLLLEHVSKNMCLTRGYNLAKRNPVPTVI